MFSETQYVWVHQVCLASSPNVWSNSTLSSDQVTAQLRSSLECCFAFYYSFSVCWLVYQFTASPVIYSDKFRDTSDNVLTNGLRSSSSNNQYISLCPPVVHFYQILLCDMISHPGSEQPGSACESRNAFRVWYENLACWQRTRSKILRSYLTALDIMTATCNFLALKWERATTASRGA